MNILDDFEAIMKSGIQFLGRHVIASRCRSCLELKNRGSSKSGYYVIYPDGVHAVSVYCDMNTHGGGWTLLKGNIASIVGSDTTWQNQDGILKTIRARGTPHGCSDYSNYSIKVYDIKVPWSKIRMDLHRGQNGVQQCSRFRDIDNHTDTPFETFRVEQNGTETPYGMCQWGDGSWAYRSSQSYGRDKEWRIFANRMSDDRNHMYYTMVCAPHWEAWYFYEADMWVR